MPQKRLFVYCQKMGFDEEYGIDAQNRQEFTK